MGRVEDYYKQGGMVTGLTDSKLTIVKSYNRDNPYVIDFDVDKNTYVNFTGESIDGVSRVTSLSGPTGYTIDGNNDSFIGTTAQTSGILYNDYKERRKIINNDTGDEVFIPKTTFQYQSEGWNETNTSLSAITKEEMYLGIVSPPEIQNDVFIERGVTTVLEPHLRLSEVESLEHLQLYGNGYYNLIK
jgi:hypothetical protein